MRRQVRGHRLAQSAVAHDESGQQTALGMRPNAIAGGFYFGQFWHGDRLAGWRAWRHSDEQVFAMSTTADEEGAVALAR
jgi:hypothetical protein